MGRRDFLGTALAGARTDCVDPAIVDLALERGHEVTLANRWRTHPWLYTPLEWLVGNRCPGQGRRSRPPRRRPPRGKRTSSEHSLWRATT